MVLFICIFLYSGRLPVGVMEARNFITAKEMVNNGNWILPTMEGRPRYEKPPFPTWITAGVMILAGTDTNLVANRIPAGISALLLALFTFLLAKRISGNWGFAASTVLVLATSYVFMLSARKDEWDIYAHMSMAGAIWALREALVRKVRKNLYFLLSSFLMALSFYSKGPVAFWAMLLTFLISYVIVYGTKDLRENKWGLLWTFLLCMIVSAIWPSYVYFNTPHVARMVAFKETNAWFIHDARPFWFYLTMLHQIMGIWLLFLLYGLVAPFIEKNWKPEEKLAVYWFILTIVSLSFFPEKRLRYVLPAVVPGSIISTFVIYRLREAGGNAWKFMYGIFCILMGVLFIIAAGALVYFSAGRPLALVGVPLFGFVGGTILYLYIKKKTKNAHIVTIAGVCLAVVFLAPILSDHMGTDAARTFMRLRQDPEYQRRDFYTTIDILKKGAITLDIRWGMDKIVRPISLDPERIEKLKGRDKGSAIITTNKIDQEAYGLKLVNTIQTKGKIFYIYFIK